MNPIKIRIFVKSTFFVFLISCLFFSCKNKIHGFKLPKNMKEIKKVMPYVQDKVMSEYSLSKLNLYVHNYNDIRAMVYDENFIRKCSTLNCDSVCKVLAHKIKEYSKEKSNNFIDGYNEIIITLATSGDHLIKGSTIDTDYKFKIADL
jgi:hypothetical protein